MPGLRPTTGLSNVMCYDKVIPTIGHGTQKAFVAHLCLQVFNIFEPVSSHSLTLIFVLGVDKPVG